MKKILSLTSKDFETGFSSSAQSTKLGLLYTATRLNPFITEGTIRYSQEPVDIGGATVVGTIQSFAVSGADMYANDASGNLYKIATVFATPTVTKPKTGLTNTYGLEVLQTLNSSKYLYYFQNTQIGRVDIDAGSPTYTDNWKAITTGYRSDVNPTLRIDDEIYFGSKNVISKIADNGSTDTELYEAILDIPKDYIITALSTDGDYLIIAASKAVGSTLDYAETRIYFWDYKNNYDSWTRSYTLQDPQIRGMETKNGLTYAIGQYGLYALAFSKEPERIREDVKGTVGYGNISILKDAITFGYGTQCISYGKLKPGAKTSVLKPYQMADNISALDTYSSNTYGIFATVGNKLYRQTLFSAPTTYNGTAFLTSRIDLGNTYQIMAIDVIFSSTLTTNDTVAIQVQSNTTTNSYHTIAYSTHGAVSRSKSTSTAGDVIADTISLNFTDIYGTFSIKQIDIYGEEVNR